GVAIALRWRAAQAVGGDQVQRAGGEQLVVGERSERIDQVRQADDCAAALVDQGNGSALPGSRRAHLPPLAPCQNLVDMGRIDEQSLQTEHGYVSCAAARGNGLERTVPPPGSSMARRR